MLDLNGIKNIIFDLGGVIINLDQSKVYALLKQHAIDIEDNHINDSIFKNYEIGAIDENNFVKLIQDLSIELTDYEIITLWNSMLLDIPEKRIGLLRKLKENYSIYLLSNTNHTHMNFINSYVKSNFNIDKMDDLFIKAYYSHTLGMRKPDKNIFLHLLNDANIVPEETLFIDDSKEHIETANKLNLKTHWLDINSGETINKLFHENKQ